MPEVVPITLARGEGTPASTPLGGSMLFKTLAEETAGALTAFEAVNPPGEGPPLHVHRAHDEVIYVIEGTLRFRLADDIHPGATGSFVYIPRGLEHTWQNVGDVNARMLVWFVPGTRGMEQFFGAVTAAEGDPFETLSSGGDMDIVGPPLAESHPL